MQYMKSAIILLSAIALTASAASAQEKSDTLLNKSNVEKVVISESNTGVTVTVKGKDGGSDYQKEFTSLYPDSQVVASSQYEYRGIPSVTIGKDDDNARWRRTLECNIGLHIGFVAAPQKPGDMNVNIGRLNDFSLLDLLSYRARLKKSHHSFSVGFGLSWRYVSLKNSQMFHYGTYGPAEYQDLDMLSGPQMCYLEDGKVSYDSNFEGKTVKNSRVGIFSLSFPVLWHWNFAKNHNLVLGPIFNINTHGSVKTTFNDGNIDSQEASNKIGYRKFTVDAYGSITIAGGVSAYVRYSPMHFFKAGRGPEMQMLSFGLAVGL